MKIFIVDATLEFANAFTIYENAFIELYCDDVFHSTAIVL